MADVLDQAPLAAPAIATPVPDAVPSSPRTPAPSRPRTAQKRKEGLPPITWALAALAVVVLLWAAWVTKNIAGAPPPVPMASVRLEALVTEYVQAQSHSNGTPEAVTQQTARFMAAIEEELKAVGAKGTTVLVGEAVLSKNVPDITDQVRKAVYAKVPLPAAAPAAAPQVGAVAPMPAAPLQPPAAMAAAQPSPFGAAPVAAVPGLAGGSNGIPN